MAIAPYSLASVADVKTYLSIGVATFDTLIENLINQMTDAAEKECGGRRFFDAGADVEELYDGDVDRIGKSDLFLRNYPINSFTDVSYRSGDFDNPTWNIFDAGTEYIRQDNTGILHFTGNIIPGTQNIRVRCQAGFTTIPYDLALTCIKLVAREFKRRRSQGAKNENLSGASVGWNENYPADVQRILNSYKRYTF